MAQPVFSNPREKLPETQRNNTYLQASGTIFSAAKTDAIRAPGAGYSIYIWGFHLCTTVSGVTGQGLVGCGITDGTNVLCSAAATLEGPSFVMFPMPIKVDENLGVDIANTHGIIGGASLLTLFYTIGPT